MVTLKRDVVFLIDRFVEDLERQGYEFDDILDQLKEYTEICEDVYGA